MNIEYALNKEDFLTFQLYSATKSEPFRRNRNKIRVKVPIVFAILSLILYVIADTLIAVTFLFIGFLWYLLSPYYIRKRCIEYYSKYYDENYKNRFGKLETLTFTPNTIESKGIIVGESKLNLSEVEEINEIKDYYFLKFSRGVSLIIPKNRIDKLDTLKKKLQNIIDVYNIKHNQDLDWKWH